MGDNDSIPPVRLEATLLMVPATLLVVCAVVF
jgi:hypothetical protein